MRASFFAALLLATSFASPAMAQDDGCRGALSALNRVKEQITPNVSVDSVAGRHGLEVMLSALERGTHNCKSYAELWQYRVAVAQRLGQKDEYAQEQLDQAQYVVPYNPFSVPPAATPPRPSEVATVGRKWALVVGINEFEDSRVPALHYAVKDSNDFAEFLQNPEGGRFEASRIEHLVNEKATLQGIREGLGWLRANAQPDDLVVVYISSHGSPRHLDPNGVSYIITRDTNLDGPEKLYATSLQMIDLVQQLNREVKARRVVLILDTCFSGDAQTGAEAGATDSGSKTITRVWSSGPPVNAPSSVAFSEAFQNLKIGYGRAVITASRADERSWESTELKNGYFTRYLLDVLKEGHGNSTLDHVFAEVREKVSSRVQAEHGASQNPSFEFSDHADSIVLGVAETR